jgi:hypothetical protein
MKKIIIISVIFFLVVTAATTETVYSTSLFRSIASDLEKIESSIYRNDENINNPETVELFESMDKKWQKAREILFCIGNHNVYRNLDEKLVSLGAMIEINYADDAKVMVSVIKNLVDGLSNETMPVWSNFFYPPLLHTFAESGENKHEIIGILAPGQALRPTALPRATAASGGAKYRLLLAPR